MEDLAENQLPEVDSLPDGFLDSSTEPVAPATPTLEQEKPPSGRKIDVSELNSPDEAVTEVIESDKTSQDSMEKNGKQRTFPVPLSEIDGCDSSVDAKVHPVEVPNDSAVVQDKAEIVMPDSANAVISSEVKEQDQSNCQSSERPIEGDSDTQAAVLKEISSSESIEFQKNKKPETTETKRKNAKRSFKSEKEFLELTLKYQQVLAERDAALAVREKLESLCRELQRQNKLLMDECKRVSTEGQNLRLDLSVKFQDAIKDVSNKLEEQKEESLSQLKENEMLRNKLKEVADHFALSEQQYAQKLKQKTLELQIAELKIQQYDEKLAQEQSQMKIYAEQVTQLLATEKNLRLQLTADGEKFQQFQDALVKSNEVFETFKQEIDKMAKSIKELKKENTFLKTKCDKSDVTLIELVEEREKLKKQLEKTKKQLEKTKNQKERLESLCRLLQAERKQNSTGSNISDSVPL